MKSPKRAGKSFESEIEKNLLDLFGQTKDMDIRERTHRIFSSGSQKSDEGDVITCIPQLEKQFLIECKRRATKTKKEGPFLDVKLEWLDVIEKDALKRNCLPLFVGSFTGCKHDRIFVMTTYRVSYKEGIIVEGSRIRITRKYLVGIGDKAKCIDLGYKRDKWFLMSWKVFEQFLVSSIKSKGGEK